MYVGKRLIDSVDVSLTSHPKLQGQLICDTMQLLLQKHKEDLASSDQHPNFFLEGVPSLINHFQSLKDQYII
jgi:hypothetical protein